MSFKWLSWKTSLKRIHLIMHYRTCIGSLGGKKVPGKGKVSLKELRLGCVWNIKGAVRKSVLLAQIRD